jgi:hypothetical protein
MKKTKKKTKPAKPRKKPALRDALGRFKKPPLRDTPLRDKQGRFKSPKRKRPSPPKPKPLRDKQGRFKSPKRKRPSPPKPKPVKKRKRPILWIEHFVEQEKIQYAWTWKILALVPPTYNGRKDAHEDDVEGDNRILQYMHTKFVTSKRAARLELSRFVNKMTDKYDDIEFKEFTLYQVGGYGPITTKDWIEHESYNNYDDIPKR